MASESESSLPPPPYRVRIHREAPAQDCAYRAAKERLETIGWFEHALRNLGGLAAAGEADPRVWGEEGVTEVEAVGERFLRVDVERLAVFAWVSHETRTVYILHSERTGLLKRVSDSTLEESARRLKRLKSIDAERAHD